MPSSLQWTKEADRTFENLKFRFTMAPVLRLPDPDYPFVLEVDSLETGVGAILFQRHGGPPKLFLCAFFQEVDISRMEL